MGHKDSIVSNIITCELKFTHFKIERLADIFREVIVLSDIFVSSEIIGGSVASYPSILLRPLKWLGAYTS